MINGNEIDQLVGKDVYSPDGDKIGRAGQVYLDDQSGRPEWVTVRTGLFGGNESFVPLQDAQLSGDRIVVSYGKDKVKDAPNVDPQNGHIDEREEDRLYEYYGFGTAGRGTADGYGTEDQVYDQERDVAGDDVERAPSAAEGRDRRSEGEAAEVTLAEERLRVGTESREAGRARLRKYVTTEEQQVTVPVRREEVRLERVPVDDDDTAASDVDAGSAFTEDEREVVLHEEVPVVDKQVRAAEKVRLATDTTTDEHTVREEVRKEQVATEGVDEAGDEKDQRTR